MEQHPVPRNITGFQFRLIGDMTLKQFCYLAGGIGVGYLIFRVSLLPGPLSIISAVTCGLVGTAFAFLPIQERPLDKWLAAFIKSILSPTRFVWRKNNLAPAILLQPATKAIKVAPSVNQIHIDARKKLHDYLATLPSAPHEVLNQEEKNAIEKTIAMFDAYPKVSAPTQNYNVPAIPTAATIKLSPDIKPISGSVSSPNFIDVITPKPTILPNDKITIAYEGTSLQVKPTNDKPTEQIVNEHKDLNSQLQQIIKEKQALEAQLLKLKSQLNKENQQSDSLMPKIVKPEINRQEKKEPTVYTINPQEIKTEVGMPILPQTPNILSGIIKDPQKKILPNIIITIKDKSTMPIRAVKTNKLGQFATATPLPNGTYYIFAEDPLKRYIFDIVQITLSGKPFLPIEIIAKGEKELVRERLTKQIFGNATI